jgi:predicted RNA-binding protein (virulence factor B family)
MIELGKKQVLYIRKTQSFGVYLGCEGEEKTILLPTKYVPEGSGEGDAVEVFVYRDSKDRLIATTREPKLMLGETAVLEVREVGKIGAFLDWGLEKDLFLPFKEQTSRLAQGDDCLVALYIDKSHRLCATMKVYEYLKSESPYQKGDHVSGIIYQINERFGAFIAVDGKYHGLVPAKAFHGHFKTGDQVEARVVKVREDGKLELTLSEPVAIQMDKDAVKIEQLLKSYDGVLPFTEKATPEVIERELGMSKAAFKRAIGRLLKQKKIEIHEGRIRLSE